MVHGERQWSWEMSNKEKAAFWAIAALIFPAFAPVELLSGQIVAALGFVICGSTALVLALR